VTRPRSSSFPRQGWLVPAGLIALSFLPVLGAHVRLLKLAGAIAAPPADARFVDAPLPVVMHIIGSVPFLLVGAIQFSATVRARRPSWHRMAGRMLIPCGLLSALSGMWMAEFYPPVFGNGRSLTVVRLVAGSAMVVCLCLGVAAIRRRDVVRHRRWMTRGYALAIGAGTQPLTLVPTLFAPATWQEAAYLLGMSAGWVINLAVAEWFLRSTPTALLGAAGGETGDSVRCSRLLAKSASQGGLP